MSASSDPSSAAQFKFQLLASDIIDDETQRREAIRVDEREKWCAVAGSWRSGAAVATASALRRLEYAHDVGCKTLAVEAAERFAGERRRFDLLSSAIEEETMKHVPARAGLAEPTARLRENKARFIDTMESTGRKDVEATELEARNALAEELVLFLTRDILRNDERFVAAERRLRADEAAAREAIAATGGRKLAMFFRQFEAGARRLAPAM